MGPQPPCPLTRTCLGMRGHTLEGSLEVVFIKLQSWLCWASGPGGSEEPPSQALRGSGDGPPPAGLSPACKFPVGWQSLRRLYLLLVGVRDFATLSGQSYPARLCVLNLIVALLFSLKKISKNC